MAKISKRYKAMATKVAPGKSYGVDEALKILKDNAKTKMADLTAADMDAAVRTIAGSARSMGLVTEI